MTKHRTPQAMPRMVRYRSGGDPGVPGHSRLLRQPLRFGAVAVAVSGHPGTPNRRVPPTVDLGGGASRTPCLQESHGLDYGPPVTDCQPTVMLDPRSSVVTEPTAREMGTTGSPEVFGPRRSDPTRRRGVLPGRYRPIRCGIRSGRRMRQFTPGTPREIHRGRRRHRSAGPCSTCPSVGATNLGGSIIHNSPAICRNRLRDVRQAFAVESPIRPLVGVDSASRGRRYRCHR